MRAGDHPHRRPRRHGFVATGTTCSATGSSAPRDRRSSSSTRIPTACASRSSGATASSSRPRGTRRSPRSSAGWRRSSRPTAATPSPSTSATPTPTRSPAMLYVKALVKAIGTKNVYTASTVDQRPKELAAGLMFGGGLIVPGARHRPHRLPADARRQPVRVERQPGDGAGLAGSHRGAACSRRQARRRRPAAQPHRRRKPTSGSPCDRAPTPSCSPPWCASLLDEGLVDLGDVADYVEGLDRLGPALAAFGPDEVAGDHRRRRRQRSAASPASWPPRRGPSVYGRIGTTTAEFGTLASWLVDVLNICTGNLDRPGGAMFTTPAVAGANTRGTPRVGRGVRPNHPRSRVRGLAGTFGELPAVCLAEEIETPGDGSDPGAGRASPATRCCRSPTAGASTPPSATLDLDGVDRHLPQRDVTARRRDPPGAVGAGEAALRRRPATARRAQRRQLVGCRCCRSPTVSPTNGRSSPASP